MLTDGALLALATAAGVGVASGVVPLVNIEVYVVVLGATAPRPLLPALVVVATVAHMTGKSLMYLAGRSADRLPEGRVARRVRAARAAMAHRPALGGTLVFASALAGVPPFYAVTVASGVVGYPFLAFFALGCAGRLVRFAVLAGLPELAHAVQRW